MLLPDVSYDPDIEKYIKWLQEGIGKFKDKKPY
jgi:hypothetical protein